MIDLHVHSDASDGSLTPTELVALAKNSGISYLALTDHNTVKGLPEFLEAAKGTNLRPIAGIEFSSEFYGEELHILALNLPEFSFPQVEFLMEDVLKLKEKCNRDLVAKLQEAGYEIDYDEIRAANPHSVVVRVHIAEALIAKGYVSSVKEAFATLLEESAGYYKPPERIKSADIVKFILSIGAIPVWAHPFLRMDEAKVRTVLKELVPAGLAAMEVYYSTYTEEETAVALRLTREFGIKPSGGSDFHGIPKPDIQLGVGRGNLKISEEIAENLLFK